MFRLLLLASVLCLSGCGASESAQRAAARQWLRSHASNQNWRITSWDEGGKYSGHTSGGKEWAIVVAKLSPTARFGDRYYDELPFYFDGNDLKWPSLQSKPGEPPGPATPPLADFFHESLNRDIRYPRRVPRK